MSLRNQQCSKCLVRGSQSITLKCAHNICYQCAKRQIKLKYSYGNHIEIYCSYCNTSTNINIEQLNSIDYNKSTFITPTANQSNILFCLSCKNQCFSLEDFLAGYHRNHEVKSIDKAYPVITELLEDLDYKLCVKIDELYKQNDKLIQNKKTITEEYGIIINKIKMNFQNMRYLLETKQKQALSQYEEISLNNFESLDQRIDKVRQYISESKMYQGWIKMNIGNTLEYVSSVNQNTQQNALRCVNFYMQNYTNIDEFMNSSSYQIRKNMNSLNLQSDFKINFDDLKRLTQQMKKIKIWVPKQTIQLTNQQKIQNIQSDEDNYFERKRKEIFFNRTDNIAITATIKTQPIPQQISMKNGLDIDDKIKQLRSQINLINKSKENQTHGVRINKFKTII